MIILVIDDEKLARSRLVNLLGQIEQVKSTVEAASAVQALDMLQKIDSDYFDVVILDIQMPGMDGLSFAHELQKFKQPPAVIFVTAHSDYACRAFDLAAADYLTKPVRLERLQQALKRAMLLRQSTLADTQNTRLETTLAEPQKPAALALSPAPILPAEDNAAPPLQRQESVAEPKQAFITLTERGRMERLPVSDILYCKAEQKYVTLHLQNATRVYDGSLSELEQQYPDYFLRIHRNTLVAKTSIRTLEKASAEDSAQWVIHLHQSKAVLPISRRLLAGVKSALREQ